MWDYSKLQTVYETNFSNGLSSAQASHKLKEAGENLLTEKASIPWYCIFLRELTNFFALLLLAGSLLCFIGYGIQQDKSDKSNLILGIVIGVIVLGNATFSYL